MVHHRYQRQRRQILSPVLLVGLIQVPNLPPVSTILKEKNYLYVHSITQRCSVKKLTFLIENFFHLSPMSTLVVHLELWISKKNFQKKKSKTALMVYSGARGKLIHEKTWSRKPRGTVPFREYIALFPFISVERKEKIRKRKNVLWFFFGGGGD